MNGKGSKPRPYKPDDHDQGYDKIDEGIFVEDIWKGERPHSAFTFEGERIRVIMPAHGGEYRVFFDDKPWITLDKWKICQEVNKYD